MMKHLIKYFAFFAVAIGFFAGSGCAPMKYSNAYIYNKKSGLANQPWEKELSFTIVSKAPFSISETVAVEKNEGVFLKIYSIMDGKSTLMNLKEPIPKGKYQVRAHTEDKNFKVAPNLVFIVTVNGEEKRLEPEVKKDVPKK